LTLLENDTVLAKPSEGALTAVYLSEGLEGRPPGPHS
jgi:hypothetical protein